MKRLSLLLLFTCCVGCSPKMVEISITDHVGANGNSYTNCTLLASEFNDGYDTNIILPGNWILRDFTAEKFSVTMFQGSFEATNITIQTQYVPIITTNEDSFTITFEERK